MSPETRQRPDVSEILEELDQVGAEAEGEPSPEVGDLEVGEELPQLVQALLLKKKRIGSLFNGEGKPEFSPGGGRLDNSSSGYDFSVLLALIRAGVRDPNDLATTLYHRPDGGAKKKGLGYISRTVRNALELSAAADEHLAGATLNFTVEEVAIYDCDPARYRLTIEGKELVLSSADLKGKGRFAVRFMDALHFAPTLPDDQKDWLSVVNGWLADAAEIAMPPEASEENALRTAVKHVIRDLPLGTTIDDLDRDMAVDLGEEERGFKADAVLNRIQEKRPKVERGDVCRVLRDLGYASGTERVEGEAVRLWKRVTV